MSLSTIRVATAHISPHLLSKRLSTQKTIEYIRLAAQHDANLVCFPESSIPGFPIWASLLPPSHPSTHDFFRRFAEESVAASQEEVSAIQAAARARKISISLGISEKLPHNLGTLWNSNLLINESGEIVAHHRKLACTWFEKLLWSPGDGSGLRTMTFGPGDRARVSALVCGENTNPLARYAILSLGTQVHVSTWPAMWPSRMPIRSNAASKGKNYDNVLANRIRAAAMCFEAKCFGVMCAGHFSQENLETLLSMLDPSDKHTRDTFEYALQNTSRAASMILDPTGVPVDAWAISESGEKKDVEMLQDEEGLLFADLNLKDCIEGKQYHDLLGGYQRPDVFSLRVNRTRRVPVTYDADDHPDALDALNASKGPRSTPAPYNLNSDPVREPVSSRY